MGVKRRFLLKLFFFSGSDIPLPPRPELEHQAQGALPFTTIKNCIFTSNGYECAPTCTIELALSSSAELVSAAVSASSYNCVRASRSVHICKVLLSPHTYSGNFNCVVWLILSFVSSFAWVTWFALSFIDHVVVIWSKHCDTGVGPSENLNNIRSPTARSLLVKFSVKSSYRS